MIVVVVFYIKFGNVSVSWCGLLVFWWRGPGTALELWFQGRREDGGGINKGRVTEGLGGSAGPTFIAGHLNASCTTFRMFPSPDFFQELFSGP